MPVNRNLLGHGNTLYGRLEQRFEAAATEPSGWIFGLNMPCKFDETMRVVRELNTLPQLAGLRLAWGELLCETADATWFQSLEWLETYWQFFGKGQRLRVLLIEDAGRVVGILPFVVGIEFRRVGRVKVLTYPLHGWGTFYGPIGPDPTATLEAGLKHLRQTPRDWDLLELRWAARGGIGDAIVQSLNTAGFDYVTSRGHAAAQVELIRGWETYWRSRKSHWRNNVRRSVRQLSTCGEIEHVRYRPLGAAANDADPRWDLFDACVELARRSWQGSSRTGTTLSHASVRDYLRAAHTAAAKSGAVDLNLLLLDGQPVAFAYNYYYRGSVYGLRSGFDASIAQQGAGTVLMAQMIEDSCRRGDHLIDLGPDYFDCKRPWLTRLQPADQYTHYRAGGLRAQALRLTHAVRDWLPAKVLSSASDKRNLPKGTKAPSRKTETSMRN
ncbi:MAG: GNAT family N-acetyltransferase [Pirellulales bacterium]|nr:GNAT family N-acetyltransferase [Pirellulales bacterium]